MFSGHVARSGGSGWDNRLKCRGKAKDGKEERMADPVRIEAISDHIEKHIGTIDTVFHEIASDNLHIDIHYVAPSAENTFYTLVTSGMSERPMTVPDGLEAVRFAELLISLPADWPISMEALEKEENYWPIRLLKILARFPHENDTFLYPGHTIQKEDDRPYAPNTGFCGVLITIPYLTPNDFWSLRIDDEDKIQFYALTPIYKEELGFKLKHGAEKLLELLDGVETTELLDIKRKNVCE